ncbi:MAG: SDR family oxidoreductase [Gammaproteobacteria bacterium]|nr:SDR family oxidoreductase [Gammaproteobacteria bacterium]
MTSQNPPSDASGFRLDGRHALITGAGKGLGRAAALALGAAGAHVYAVARTAEDVAGVCAELIGRGGDATPIVADVTKSEDLRRVFGELPRLDVLVNNAGSNIPEPMVDVSEDHLDYLLGLNVRAAFLVAQAAARCMAAQGGGGSIIHMSSQMGHVGAVNRSVYCMTKHAIEGLTKAMAVELAPLGIRVNSLAPTFIETPLTSGFMKDPDFRRWVIDRLPVGRLGTEQDIMGAVVFLASPASTMITGTSLRVDGGWTAQ